MRAINFLLVAALGAAMAAPAYAQGVNASGLRPLYGIERVETSPIGRLEADARAWVAEERARQKARPGDLVELALDIDSNIGPAIKKLAKRERVGNGDLMLVIMYEITAGARDDVEADLQRLRKGGAPETEIQALTAVKAELDVKVAEVVRDQTNVSRSLVPQLAWSEQ